MTSFPSSGSFIEQVRTSCRNVRQDAGIKVSVRLVNHQMSITVLRLTIPNSRPRQISIEAIDKFLTQTLNETDFNRLKSHHGVSAFPLRFPTLVSEINFLAILSLLNTLSGYRLPLHKATGDGAYQNIIKILVGLFITGEDKLTSRGLSELTAEEIAGILGVSLFSEKPHESLPGVTVGTKGGEVAEAVDLVVKACNETGKALLEAGYKSLGDLVVEILDEAEKITESKGDTAGADHFIERVSDSITRSCFQKAWPFIHPI